MYHVLTTIMLCDTWLHDDTFCRSSFTHERILLFVILWLLVMVFFKIYHQFWTQKRSITISWYHHHYYDSDNIIISSSYFSNPVSFHRKRCNVCGVCGYTTLLPASSNLQSQLEKDERKKSIVISCSCLQKEFHFQWMSHPNLRMVSLNTNPQTTNYSHIQ